MIDLKQKHLLTNDDDTNSSSFAVAWCFAIVNTVLGFTAIILLCNALTGMRS